MPVLPQNKTGISLSRIAQQWQKLFRYALTGYSTTEHHRNGVSRFESVWQLFNQAVVFLQRFYSALAIVAILYTLNSLYSRNCPSKRCDVTYLVLQAHFANCFAVFCVVALCLWCVDYKTNFLVHNTAETKHSRFARLKALTQPFMGLQIILNPISYPQHPGGRRRFCLQLHI